MQADRRLGLQSLASDIQSSTDLHGVAPEEILTIVTGLPRSGTSLMMQIPEAAGIPLFTDGKRPANASNERGYHEHERTASLLTSPDKSWLSNAKGHAIKIVAPLLTTIPDTLKTRILFMDRSMNGILQSQSSMLDRLGKEPPRGDVTRGYLQQSRHARTWINARGIPALGVRYQSLVHRPDEILSQIAAFLGAEDNLEAMRDVIDPTLHRARAEGPWPWPWPLLRPLPVNNARSILSLRFSGSSSLQNGEFSTAFDPVLRPD